MTADMAPENRTAQMPARTIAAAGSLAALLLAGLVGVSSATVAYGEGAVAMIGPQLPVEDAEAAPETVGEAIATSADPLGEALGAYLGDKMARSEAVAAAPYLNARRWQAVADFYAARENAPVWSADGIPSLVARRLIGRLGQADRDGLTPADYALPAGLARTAGKLDAQTVARFETHLSAALLAYAEEAQAGRVAPNDLSRSITASPKRPKPVAALQSLAEASDPLAVLDGFNPPHPQFQALREQLALLRQPKTEEERPVVVPAGKALKPGASDPRVAALRQRLGVEVTEGGEAERFDDPLKEAVLAFQRDNGLHPDGIVGARTLLALNAVADDGMAVSDVIANMERWRWMPRDLGAFHIFVNIPEFQARLYRDGTKVYETRIVVGKPSNQTPVFSDVMDHVIVNPYWNVPYSIVSQEMLPSIQANPNGYLGGRNYEVLAGGRVVNPASVDWAGGNLRSVRIRQRPGRGNALGQIKFMFPNKHSVYLHDTPSKSLFGRSSRAFSHGCVRVKDPFDFADALLQLDENWSAARLKKLVGGQERRVDLTHAVPVHLAYFTAFVDAEGRLQRRPDIYGHNATLTKALEIDGWQEWQRFAVAAPVVRGPRRAAPAKAATKEAVHKDVRTRRAELQRLRQQRSNDMYR